jgi:hypothetical protein
MPSTGQVSVAYRSSATTNMSSAPVYSLQQERQLFGHTLQCLEPGYITFGGVSFRLQSQDGTVADKCWDLWTQVKASGYSRGGEQILPKLLLVKPNGEHGAPCKYGEASITVDGDELSRLERLLKLNWIEVNKSDSEPPTAAGVRPAPLLLQLVLQLARLAKIRHVLVGLAAYKAHPFYRSLGFFSLGDPSHSIRGFMINPQSAFNTISGLLDTRSRDDVPKSMHAVFRDLPWLQPAFGVQRQR